VPARGARKRFPCRPQCAHTARKSRKTAHGRSRQGTSTGCFHTAALGRNDTFRTNACGRERHSGFRSAGSSGSRIVLGVVVGVLLLCVALIIVVQVARNTTPPPPAAPVYVPMPKYVVASVDTENCSRLFDYCVRGKCHLLNAGDAAGRAHVEMTLLERGKQQGVNGQDIDLAPGERKTVSHDFTEAHFAAGISTVQCKVD